MAVDGNAFQTHTPVAGLYKAAGSTLSDGEQDTLRLDSAGSLKVAIISGAAATTAGDVAHDAADSGSPVKIGGKGSAAVAAAVTEGDRVNASFTLEGRLRTTGEGTIAHDAADGGNPLKIGGKANAAVVAVVTEGDRVDASFDLRGALRTVDIPPGAAWSVTNSAAVNNIATATQASAGAGLKNFCKSIQYSLWHDNTGTVTAAGGLVLVVRDGASGAGTVIFTRTLSGPVATNGLGQSGQINFDPPLIGTAATAMCVEFTTGLTHSGQDVNMQGGVTR